MWDADANLPKTRLQRSVASAAQGYMSPQVWTQMRLQVEECTHNVGKHPCVPHCIYQFLGPRRHVGFAVQLGLSCREEFGERVLACAACCRAAAMRPYWLWSFASPAAPSGGGLGGGEGGPRAAAL